jgi:AcrR family transcriptional regulator
MKKTTSNSGASDRSISLPAVKLPDQRALRSRAAVLSSTVELLSERGYGGTSVDEISRRSGVAKTTIYRHWPTRTDLLRDACSTLGTPLDRPDAPNLEDALTAVLKNLASLLRSEKWASVLPSIIDAAERDPDIASMYSELQGEYSSVFRDVLLAAVDSGRLPKDTDVSALIALLVGPLFYRRWFSREVVSDAFAEQVVAKLFP